jgi:hypothetical protein
MRASLRSFAIVSAVILGSSSSALALDALAYQQAVQACNWGNMRACTVVQQYLAPAQGSSPADRWMGPDEPRYARPGILSHRDFLN